MKKFITSGPGVKQHLVGTEPDPNCLQRLSADDISRHRVHALLLTKYSNIPDSTYLARIEHTLFLNDLPRLKTV